MIMFIYIYIYIPYRDLTIISPTLISEKTLARGMKFEGFSEIQGFDITLGEIIIESLYSMYVYLYIHIYTHTYIRTYTYTYVCIYTHY